MTGAGSRPAIKTVLAPPRALLALALGAVLAGLLLITAPAEAHALLERSDPPLNATLRESPRVVNLVMSEPLQQDFSTVEVLDGQGQRVDRGGTLFNRQDSTRMSVQVEPLDAGVYTVAWRTLSEVDGHTWTGSFAFTVLNPDGSAPAGAAFAPDLSRPGPPAGADAAVKWFSFTALIALIGGTLFALWAARPAARLAGAEGPRSASSDSGSFSGAVSGAVSGPAFLEVALRYAWEAATVAVMLLILATGYDAAAAALKLGGLEFLDEALFDTRNGLWLLVRWSLLMATVALLLATQWRPQLRASREALLTLVVLGAGLVGSFARISHGAALDQGWIWATLFDALHFAAAAVWIGMLAALVWTLWRTRGMAKGGLTERRQRHTFQIEAVRRFSWVAAGTVPVLISAGLLSLLAENPIFRGFVDTDWGVAMLVKLGLLALLFAVAATNALALRPRAQRAGAQAAGAEGREGWPLERRLRALMRVELGLALAVLAVTAALTQLPSARSELPAVGATQKDRAISETIALGDLVAQLTVEPNLVGINRYEVALRQASGGAASASLTSDRVTEVRLHFRYEDPAVGPVIVPAEAASGSGGERFVLEGAFFGLAGAWEVEVEVRRELADDVIGGITTEVEQGFIELLPFGQEQPGALSLPITQFDWNGIGALWAAVAAGLLVAYRAPLRQRVSRRAGNISLATGALCMAAAVILVWGVETDLGRTRQNPIERTSESVAGGAALFATNCAQCHGAGGLGDGPLAGTLPAAPANFRVHVPFHPDGVLFAWISDGISGTGMPAWSGELREQERWDLVNFLRSNFDRPLESN